MKRIIQRAAAVWLAAATIAGAGEISRRTPIVDAVERVMPSVVNISTERLVQRTYTDPLQRFRGDLFDQFFRDFFGQIPAPGFERKQSLGSGVVIDPAGFILTNFHVIERASRISVMLADNAIYEATFIAGDAINDLALIKVDAGHDLPALPMAKDDDLLLGETVIALGNPFGLAHTVTVGVLSAKDREARYGGEVLYRDILQTDAAVNPGNSGGPLVNINGELIGINVAIYQQAQNIGFAVPIKRARALAGRWLSSRSLRKLWLGFEPGEAPGRLTIETVDPEGPAARAGAKVGDAILTLGGQSVTNLFDFNRLMLRVGAGQKIEVGLADGRKLMLPLVALPKPRGDVLAKKLLGLEFETGGRQGVLAMFKQGLPVANVEEGTPLAEAGMRPGMLVTRVNGAEVSTLDDVGLALENARAGQTVAIEAAIVTEREGFIIAHNVQTQVAVRAP